MRAGPLSDDKVIDTLNHYFVPVYVSNEDYEKDGPASQPERKDRERIYAECDKNGTSVGTVHVYLLAPDGRAIDSAHVAAVTGPGKLLPILDRCIRKLGTKPGDPIVQPRGTSVPPSASADSLMLHLVSRGENTGPQSGSWREFPAENWIALSPAEARGLLPQEGPRIGASYDANPQLASRLFRYFYPQSEDPSDNPWTKIQDQSLKGTVLSVADGIATARLEGSVRLWRNFYPHQPSPEHMSATVLGFVQWDVPSRRITSFKLVTDQATKDKEKFAVVVASER